MKNKWTICFGAALLVAGVAVAQPMANEAGAAGIANALEGTVLLYDQTDSAGGNGAPDQDFEAAFDGYDAEGADDFDVDWAALSST